MPIQYLFVCILFFNVFAAHYLCAVAISICSSSEEAKLFQQLQFGAQEIGDLSNILIPLPLSSLPSRKIISISNSTSVNSLVRLAEVAHSCQAGRTRELRLVELLQPSNIVQSAALRNLANAYHIMFKASLSLAEYRIECRELVANQTIASINFTTMLRPTINNSQKESERSWRLNFFSGPTVRRCLRYIYKILI